MSGLELLLLHDISLNMFYFHFHLSQDISWFLLISSLIHCLFRSILFHLHVFENFPVFFSLISNFIPLWLEKMHDSFLVLRLLNCFMASIQFGCSVVSNSLQPHGLQHTWFPCPSLFPGVCSNSCQLGWWCHPTISSCLQTLPVSESFPASRLWASGGQSIGASVLASILPMNIQYWFPLRLTGWISLLSKGLSRVFSRTTFQKHQFFGTQPFLLSNSHIHTWLLEKPWFWLDRPLSAK